MLILFAAREKEIKKAKEEGKLLFGEGVYSKENPAICSTPYHYKEYLNSLTDEDVLFIVDTYNIHGPEIDCPPDDIIIKVGGEMPVIKRRKNAPNGLGYVFEMPIKNKKFVLQIHKYLLDYLAKRDKEKHTYMSPDETPAPKKVK